MTDPKQFKPGHGYSKQDWDDVSDSPELSEADFARARPFAEVFPKLAESIERSRGRPRSAVPKKQVTLRLDQDVIDAFKASGPGWQSRINEALRKAGGL
jgi:uncharacterized protein (DUF4415 family)